MKTVTQRQLELLTAIETFTRRNRFMPSQRDLAKAMNCTQHTVQELLAALGRNDYVKWQPKVARTIHVTNSGRSQLAAGKKRAA